MPSPIPSSNASAGGHPREQRRTFDPQTIGESLDRWHDVSGRWCSTTTHLRLIRGLAPGMIERGDGHIINVATWGVLAEASPLFSVYNASQGRTLDGQSDHRNQWARNSVRSTTLYYPWATPMIAPTRGMTECPRSARPRPVGG